MSAVHQLLRPVGALVGWTFVMESWMYATRLPAMSKYKVEATPTFTKEKLNSKIPAPVRWVADNYDHLHEAPTRFYAVTLGLALYASTITAPTTLASNFMDTEANLAWLYVGLRVAHSIVQASYNDIMTRFALFASSEIVMFALFARGAYLLWWAKDSGVLI